MAQLQVTVCSGTGFQDIAPSPGCCGERRPSRPLLYFMLESTVGVWQTEPADIRQGGGVAWGHTFRNIKCRDPEGDRLDIFVVDGQHWQPDRQSGPKNRNRDPPRQNSYGRYKMAVIQFERAKEEQQTLVLQTAEGRDTTYSFTVAGVFHDSNIDDARLEPPPQPGPPAAPPPPLPGELPGPPVVPPPGMPPPPDGGFQQVVNPYEDYPTYRTRRGPPPSLPADREAWFRYWDYRGTGVLSLEQIGQAAVHSINEGRTAKSMVALTAEQEKEACWCLTVLAGDEAVDLAGFLRPQDGLADTLVANLSERGYPI